ncbi:MAG: sigma factor-like helix-turn-helix DNA-binding protein [Pedobacter sp.]|uniref:sigma factor-like helix-turn-helix DNA-binding protein n=1 Tax=Pedobacter sp. TaxID=1411316 RepID=UPI00280A45B9|nr:sigma factor-like helix-turn-helix DNA-binding protein [Pedobacter sp.]MDQ8003388.1 sigma factor-like helix-turn-helix DNA-binding protein [Pedobacter sp.]
MKRNYALNFDQFREGNEKGLTFFYQLWYPKLYYWCFRYIKDDINADCIVNEAFLRLWLARKQMEVVEQLELFVRKLIADGCRAFYKTANHQFQRSMLRLDEIDDYQDWMAGFDPRLESEEQALYEQAPDEQLKEQWAQVERVIPSLNLDQQLFVRLCMKYGFDYGRIAWHVGGVSDHQVARKVEKILKELKAILSDTKKLGTVKNSQFTFQGDVSEEQSEILRMRYTLGYSFAEIAKELNLPQGDIQRTFVNAMTKVKKEK